MQSAYDFMRLWGHFCSKDTTPIPSMPQCPGARVVNTPDPASCTEESIQREWRARSPTGPSPLEPLSIARLLGRVLYNAFTCTSIFVEVDVCKLAALKKQLLVGRDGWFSSWELLIAIIMKARMTTQPGTGPAEYTAIVNCRGRNRHYPPEYVGNAVLEQNFAMPPMTGPEHPVGDIAAKVHDDLRGFIADGDQMPWILDLYDRIAALKKPYNQWTVQGAFGNRVFWFNSFAAYPWLDIAFCDIRASEYGVTPMPFPPLNFCLLCPYKPGKQLMQVALTKKQAKAAMAQLQEYDCIRVTTDPCESTAA